MSSFHEFAYPSLQAALLGQWLPNTVDCDVSDLWATAQWNHLDMPCASLPQSPTPSASTTSTGSTSSLSSPRTPVVAGSSGHWPSEPFTTSGNPHNMMFSTSFPEHVIPDGLALLSAATSAVPYACSRPLDTLESDCAVLLAMHLAGASATPSCHVAPTPQDAFTLPPAGAADAAANDAQTHFAEAYGFSIAEQLDGGVCADSGPTISLSFSTDADPIASPAPVKLVEGFSTSAASAGDDKAVVKSVAKASKATVSAKKGRSKGKRFICKDCNRTFSRAFNLHTHIATHRNIKMFDCPATACEKSFSRRHDLGRHLSAVHEEFLSVTGQSAQEAVAPLKKNENAKAALAVAVSDIAAPIHLNNNEDSVVARGKSLIATYTTCSEDASDVVGAILATY